MSVRENPSWAVLANFSHSLSVKGSRWMVQVSLLCRPPWLLMILFVIHDVELPQTIKTMSCSLRAVAQAFQKCSSALTNPDLGVSIHESSSRKMIFFLSSEFCKKVCNAVNASLQFLGTGCFGAPAEIRESLNEDSCFFRGWSARPVCWNVKW